MQNSEQCRLSEYRQIMETHVIQILNIRFRALARHEWEPSYPVSLKHHDRNIDSLV